MMLELFEVEQIVTDVTIAKKQGIFMDPNKQYTSRESNDYRYEVTASLEKGGPGDEHENNDFYKEQFQQHETVRIVCFPWRFFACTAAALFCRSNVQPQVIPR